MDQKTPEVLIVIINYNNTDDTIACIKSIQKNERAAAYKIMLVDNGSANFDAKRLKNIFPDITITVSKKNLGFSGGVNIGIKEALCKKSPYTLLINNDTIVTPGFLSKLIATFKENPEYAVIAPLITYADNPDIIWFRGGSYNKYTSITRHVDMNKNKAAFDAKTFPTGFITGCCMLIQTEIFKKIGFFDEQYFLYNEDLDFCHRCARNNLKLAVNPQAEIMHKVSGSTNSAKNTDLDPHRFTKIKAYYTARNDLVFIKKNLRGIPKLTSLISTFTVKYPYFSFQMLKRKQFAGLMSYFKGMGAGIMYKIQK